ncbi:MAG: CRISPR-associated endoribonuclease Cas6 [Methanobacteriota archaeon]
MRLLIKLKALKDCAYDITYYPKMQGFVYSLLKDTEYSSLHDKKAYKFFSFSNIFPASDFKSGDERRFMISSPDEKLIETFKNRLTKLEQAAIGEMLFRIKEVAALNPKITKSCTLKTGTPIVIRIPKENYAEYGISPPKNYDYLYWRKNYSFNAFLRQLEDNLFKKYSEFYGLPAEPSQIFEQFKFLKPVSIPIPIDGKNVSIIASLWEFIFGYIDREKQKLLQFGLDAGFGELNSIGFGFMNIRK